MKNRSFLFTSESVGDGHPDKICDRISDAILDAHMEQDPTAKVAVETVASIGLVLLCGEVASTASVNYQKIVRRVLKDIGYDCCIKGMDYKTVNVMVCIKEQSSDISQAVNKINNVCDGNHIAYNNCNDNNCNDNLINNHISNIKINNHITDNINDCYVNLNTGAGDQGIMFGYATNETPEMMPASLLWAHRIVRELRNLRKTYSFIHPDCKSQVTVQYNESDGVLTLVKIHTIVISTQHSENISTDELRAFLKKNLIEKIIPENLRKETLYYIQPSGRFVLGGPAADAGLTGRKIIVDSYGGFGCNGGGCFSGKDWSKVDRSGAYAARWIAKSLIHSKLCKRVLVQISYAIGISHPLSVFVDTYGTGVFDDLKITELINSNFDLRPGAIVRDLGLDKPIFERTAVFGHFGREGFSWEDPKLIKY